jgi:flavin reductase (DIM6/NTAB) family NADH-FMN oxidoreductase RutF
LEKDIDAKTFWTALGARAVGAAIVTAEGSAGPAGFLALSATHLSATPPIMMVSIGLATSALGAIREAQHFAINYVPKDRADLVREFGGGGSLKGAYRFAPGDWGTLSTGAPTLANGVGIIDCRLDETLVRHGAVIALGRVVDFIVGTSEPLISFRGGYM